MNGFWGAGNLRVPVESNPKEASACVGLMDTVTHQGSIPREGGQQDRPGPHPAQVLWVVQSQRPPPSATPSAGSQDWGRSAHLPLEGEGEEHFLVPEENV